MRSGATTFGSKVVYKPIRSLVCSVPRLQHKIQVLQATIDIYEVTNIWSLETRLCFQVRSAFSTIGLARPFQAPPPCNCPPSKFDAWAASTHGWLSRTIRYILYTVWLNIHFCMLLDSPMLITVSLSSFAMAMRTFGTLSLERRRRMGRHSAAKVPQEIRPSRRNDSHCLTYLMEGGGGVVERKDWYWVRV